MKLKRILMLSIVFAMLLHGAEWRLIGRPGVLASLPDQSCKVPQFSPDGENVAFSTNNYQGIYVVSATGGAIAEISSDIAAGWRFTWSPDSRKIAARVSHPETYSKSIVLYDLQNRDKANLEEKVSRLTDFPLWLNSENLLLPENRSSRILSLSSVSLDERPVAWFSGSTVYWRNADGQTRSYVLSQKSGIISLALAPDGEKAAIVQKNGMLSILYKNENLVSLGEGFAPAWNPESDAIVFMQTEDDGHDYTAGDLYIASITGNIQPLLITADTIEMYPHWSPDGSTIVYENYSDGTISLINVERRR